MKNLISGADRKKLLDKYIAILTDADHKKLLDKYIAILTAKGYRGF